LRAANPEDEACALRSDAVPLRQGSLERNDRQLMFSRPVLPNILLTHHSAAK
jgi:hypothetical protein